MPAYTYVCDDHPKRIFEYVIRSIHDIEVPPKCPKCGEVMTRIFDAAPTHFRGNGWGKD